MKKIYILFFIFFSSSVGADNFEELVRESTDLKESFSSFHPPLRVVQKRYLPKSFLSEIGLAFSPVLKGFNYLNTSSIDLSYRFFLTNYWSIGLKYSSYFNTKNQEAYELINNRGHIPLEIKNFQKHSYLAGLEWYPFYGKTVFYNYLLRFDFYFSLFGGFVDLFSVDEKTPMLSLGLGFVHWWHKHFNTRLSVSGYYYQYSAEDFAGFKKNIYEHYYKIDISAGVLF